jgi:hypothetical protein
MSAVKRVQSVSDTMLHTLLRGHGCNVIVLNVNAPTEDTTYMKESSMRIWNKYSINSLTTV